MKIRTHRLSGTALVYACAVADGLAQVHVRTSGSVPEVRYLYPTFDGWYGWPVPRYLEHVADDIIDREKIETRYVITDSTEPNYWSASCLFTDVYSVSGTTRREAAMRCYVASKLGGEVDVPEELL